MLSLIASEWGTSPHPDRREKPVVRYREPSALRKDLEEMSKMPMTISNSGLSSSADGANQLTTALRAFQDLSVDTSHPYFFNQLFGPLDPAALAGELLSCAQNTSGYTYEAAPVYSMLEVEVSQAPTTASKDGRHVPTRPPARASDSG
jgi:hypothetical protein